MQLSSASGKYILVVEDELVVAKDLQRTLSSLGYNVPTTAASAEDALRMASKRCPDVVLMDIRIRGELDGIETASIFRSRFDVPVIFLTAYADAETVARAKAAEPHGYLLKPVKKEDLRSAVEIALYKHVMERRLRERERWFATTIRSIGDAVIATDAAGQITFMNPVAELLSGWRMEDAKGRSLADILQLVDEFTKKAIENPIARALREGRVVNVEGVAVSREGHQRTIADSAAPIRNDSGDIMGAVFVFRDVSDGFDGDDGRSGGARDQRPPLLHRGEHAVCSRAAAGPP
jgi:two-component system cell cycle sensor histidine kinase/response regulator CckA